jgi:two-component system sensor histidine kinase/response regulator
MAEKASEGAATILVIDDELGMREGCRRALTPLGHSVDTAANLAAGTTMIRSQTYDLFLLDVMLPDGSGLDVIGPILQRDPNAICIIITGFGSIEMAVAAVRRGAYDFISKPFTADELIMAVNQGLERRRLKTFEYQAAELARAKEELEKLDLVKSQLMLKVAHELRAPVAAVQSYINLLLAGYLTDQELNPTLKRIQERLQEMLDVISDLLDLARLKEARDQFAAAASPQPVADLLEEVCDLFREQAREKEQRFLVEIVDRPTMVANRNHLKQIWTNLISNAIKYTPRGGRIAVSLEAEGDNLVSMVEDSGIGIAEQDMANLFQEFFRSDQAKASGEIGTGLGLSIVKQIVDSYGGDIQVASRLGQGTRFTVTLPLDPSRSQATLPMPSPTPLPAVHRPLADSRTHARALIQKEEGQAPGGEAVLGS